MGMIHILKDEGRQNQLFANINLESLKHETWREKCVRLQLLLTTNESAIYVPTSSDVQLGPVQSSVPCSGTCGRSTGTRTLELELAMLSSAHHGEMNPSDAGFQDRYVIEEVIKQMAKNRLIDAKRKRAFKVLVLNEVDKLSREAQHSLRRTMLKYSSSCRLILCCNSSSKVIEAVRSGCLNVRVKAPTEDQIIQVLEFIGKKENLHLPAGFAARYPFAPNQVAHWEQYVPEIATDILTQQSPKRLYAVRQKLYELLVNYIPPESILKKLLIELLSKLDADLKHEICHWAAHYITSNNEWSIQADASISSSQLANSSSGSRLSCQRMSKRRNMLLADLPRPVSSVSAETETRKKRKAVVAFGRREGSKKCFKKLGWPMDSTADFFQILPKPKVKLRSLPTMNGPCKLMHPYHLHSLQTPVQDHACHPNECLSDEICDLQNLPRPVSSVSAETETCKKRKAVVAFGRSRHRH
ncbi:hypothetical protein ACP4OV_010538 [Aristida adscensionis]